MIHVENLSAEEAAEKESARFPEENGYRQRAQGAGPQKSRWQKAFEPLVVRPQVACGFSF